MEQPETQNAITFEQRRFEQLRFEKNTQELGSIAIYGYEKRRYDEITSGLAEALSGSVDTHYPFELRDGVLIAEDGEPIEELLVRGLRNDIKKANRDSFFEFLPQRSKAELDNFRLQQAMANGELKENTIIEVSPYTEELDTSESNRHKLIEAAQKPYWARTMVRLSHWDGEKLHIYTLSSDNLKRAEVFENNIENSSVEIFKEAAKRVLDYEYRAQDSGEMLAEPILLQIENDSWKTLARDFVAEADVILSERHGGRWEQGRPENDSANLQQYVESQKEVLDGLFNAEKRIAAECPDYENYQKQFNRELFNCIALLEKRLELGKIDEVIIDYGLASAGAGALASAEGRSYDMCGMVISSSESNVAQQSGSESLLRLIGKPVECPFCEKKVIVPAGDLAEGNLYCKNCDLGIDVCTGKKFTKGKIRQNSQKTSLVDLIGQELAEWNRKYDIEQAEKKLNKQSQNKAKQAQDLKKAA